MNMGKRGQVTPSSNIHYKTAYLDWRESCSTDLGVRFRENYPCDLTDCYGGSVGRIVSEVARLITLFRTSGWPFRRSLKRYFAAIHCIRRVSLSYFETSRALQATYMSWWVEAEKQWKIDDEQKRLDRKVPSNGAAGERYRKLAENISMNIKDDLRREALKIHLRKIKFAFMKKYSVWLKQYKAYNTEMKRKRREAMLLRHSKIGKDNNPVDHSTKIDAKLKEYRREFIKHIMSKPSIKLNPKAEKLELMYEAVDQVEEERVKTRERQLMAQFEKEKREKLRQREKSPKAKVKSKQLNVDELEESQQQQQQQQNLKSPLSPSPSRANDENNDDNAITPMHMLSPKVDELSTMFRKHIKNNNNNNNNTGSDPASSSMSPTASPLALTNKFSGFDDNNNINLQQHHHHHGGFVNNNNSHNDEREKYKDQVIDLYAKPPPPKPTFGMDFNLASLNISNAELYASLGDFGSATHNSTSSQNKFTTNNNTTTTNNKKALPSIISQESLPPPLPPPPQANRHRTTSPQRSQAEFGNNNSISNQSIYSSPSGAVFSPSPSIYHHQAQQLHSSQSSASAAFSNNNSIYQEESSFVPPVTNSARESILKRIMMSDPPPMKMSPFHRFGDNRQYKYKPDEKQNNNNSKQQEKKIDDSAHDANVSRLYFPNSCPFRILDDKGLSEIDLSCRRVQKEALRRAALNAKYIEEEDEEEKRRNDQASRHRLVNAKRGAGISEKLIQNSGRRRSSTNLNNNNSTTNAISPKKNRQTTFLDDDQDKQRKKNFPMRKTGILPSDITVDMIQEKLHQRNRTLLKSLSPSRNGTTGGEFSQSSSSKFHFSPFSRSRFSANISHDHNNQTSNPASQITHEMLTNAVSTGSSWTPSRVITQRTEDGSTIIPSAGATQHRPLLLPSTKAISKNVSSSPSSSMGGQQQQQQQQQPSTEAAIFDYLVRTGSPAMSSEEVKQMNRNKVHQLRPMLENKINTTTDSSSLSPFRNNTSTNTRGNYYTANNNRNTDNLLHSIRNMLSTSQTPPPPSKHRIENRLNQVNSMQHNMSLSPSPAVNSASYSSSSPSPAQPFGLASSHHSAIRATRNQRKFEVNSMARTPPPYLQ